MLVALGTFAIATVGRELKAVRQVRRGRATSSKTSWPLMTHLRLRLKKLRQLRDIDPNQIEQEARFARARRISQARVGQMCSTRPWAGRSIGMHLMRYQNRAS